MNKYQHVSIPRAPERVLLSDVAPFELPPNISSVGFYALVTNSKMRWSGQSLVWSASAPASHTFIGSLLAGMHGSTPPTDAKGRLSIKIEKSWRLPHKFAVRKSDGQRRTLSLPHPLSQLQIVNYYRRNSSALLYACSKSPFSLRRPEKEARYTFTEDALHVYTKSRASRGIEASYREHEIFTSYFRYKSYSNINKFYESKHYHELEARYSFQRRLDITRCFESLYTHSLDWAIRGHYASKQGLEPRESVFSKDLDGLFQAANYGQTNGLLVGPEFSRIAAELVLQAVDVSVQEVLSREFNLKYDRDYWIGRYVDDFFVFCDDTATADLIQDSIETELERYNLRLNKAKEHNHAGPSHSPIDAAKKKIGKRVRKYFKDFQNAYGDESSHLLPPSVHSVISYYKSQVASDAATPAQVNNFVLSVIEKRLQRVIERGAPSTRRECELTTNFLRGICTLVEFLYFAAPSVSASVRATRTLFAALNFMTSDWASRTCGTHC